MKLRQKIIFHHILQNSNVASMLLPNQQQDQVQKDERICQQMTSSKRTNPPAFHNNRVWEQKANA